MISKSGRVHSFRPTDRDSETGEAEVFSHPSERAARGAVRLLLLLPLIGILWSPSSNSNDPVLGSLPFSDWYIFVWICLSALLVLTVYRAEN